MNDDDIDHFSTRRAVRGRGCDDTVKGRFERFETIHAQEEARQFETQVFRDTSRTILAHNDSPDIGFSSSLNPYRGCEHGCIYCYARPTHEYLGLSAGLDFETKLFAKYEAAALLREALMKKSWQPQVIAVSGVTDCYQPVERKLEITRACLKVLAEFRNPCVIITKNHLVTRDIDILRELADANAISVAISLTTLDSELARTMEPRASAPAQRLKAMEALREAGIRVSVNTAPLVPGLTDHEIPALLKAASSAGAESAHYTVVRLPHGVKALFSDWLEAHYPARRQKVLNHIRDTRGGKLYDADFSSRMKGSGLYAEQIEQLFRRSCKIYGLDKPRPPLSCSAFRRPAAPQAQLSLFESA